MSLYCFYDLNDEHLIFTNAKAVEDAYETIAKKYPEFLKHSHEFWSPNHIETDDFEAENFHDFVFRFQESDLTIQISARNVIQAINKVNQRHSVALESRKYKVYTPKKVSTFLREKV